MEIHDFIWNSYYQDVNKNDPHSLTLFEKKIKTLCGSLNDKTLAKYFLNSFLNKINELTPNINSKNNYFYKFKKKFTPLQQTKDSYNQSNKFNELDLKEFSILFLVINNLDIFRKNIELISEVNFSANQMNEFKKELISYLMSEKFFHRKKINDDDFDLKFKETIHLVIDNAPVKIICKNKNDSEIVLIFNEIISEIKKIELQSKIQFLEDKVSLNLDEDQYSELLSLRNQLKGG